ncbi:MAG: hypothetical protein B7Y95_22535 [Rhizobiales bacterium 32-66-11]|nr:MAG: hypothetical protein B7Y95_22535 [Rhizobiales bacterium 32-66-11]
MAKAKRVYWDSCAWLGLLNKEGGRKRPLENIYNGGRGGLYELWTSTYSLVEAYRYEHEAGKPKPWSTENLDLIKAFFNQPFIKLLPVDMEIADIARKLVRETPKLSKRPDAVHLASAIRWSLDEMHTYDGSDLLHLSGKFVTKAGTPIKICVPDEASDGPLFAVLGKG